MITSHSFKAQMHLNSLLNMVTINLNVKLLHDMSHSKLEVLYTYGSWINYILKWVGTLNF